VCARNASKWVPHNDPKTIKQFFNRPVQTDPECWRRKYTAVTIVSARRKTTSTATLRQDKDVSSDFSMHSSFSSIAMINVKTSATGTITLEHESAAPAVTHKMAIPALKLVTRRINAISSPSLQRLS
jgi:hypothetical protein